MGLAVVGVVCLAVAVVAGIATIHSRRQNKSDANCPAKLQKFAARAVRLFHDVSKGAWVHQQL